MKVADFRIQTSEPDAPSTSVIGVYADASGVLQAKTSAGTIVQVGAAWTGVIASTAIQSGVNMVILAASGVWLPVKVGTVNYAIPAYRYI